MALMAQYVNLLSLFYPLFEFWCFITVIGWNSFFNKMNIKREKNAKSYAEFKQKYF